MFCDRSGQGYFFPPPNPGSEQDTKRWRDFRQYDKDNPDIWKHFIAKAKEAYDRGYRKLGSRFIFQWIRWETERPVNSCKSVNHNFSPYYARKFMQEYPEYEGIFELRQLTSFD